VELVVDALLPAGGQVGGGVQVRQYQGSRQLLRPWALAYRKNFCR
jgi:hypothetical protein